jgi:hypothetical protein
MRKLRLVKKLSIAILLIGLSVASISSTTLDWEFVIENNDIEFYQSHDILSDPSRDVSKDVIVYKVTNTSESDVVVSWTNELYYDGICSSCGSQNEHRYSLNLKAGESIVGEANDKSKGLSIFKGFVNNHPSAKKLTANNIVNIRVTKATK